MVRRGTKVLREIPAPLDPQDLQDQLEHLAMDRRESQVQRAPKEFLAPWDHLEKPALRENPAFRHPS